MLSSLYSLTAMIWSMNDWLWNRQMNVVYLLTNPLKWIIKAVMVDLLCFFPFFLSCIFHIPLVVCGKLDCHIDKYRVSSRQNPDSFLALQLQSIDHWAMLGKVKDKCPQVVNNPQILWRGIHLMAIVVNSCAGSVNNTLMLPLKYICSERVSSDYKTVSDLDCKSHCFSLRPCCCSLEGFKP